MGRPATRATSAVSGTGAARARAAGAGAVGVWAPGGRTPLQGDPPWAAAGGSKESAARHASAPATSSPERRRGTGVRRVQQGFMWGEIPGSWRGWILADGGPPAAARAALVVSPGASVLHPEARGCEPGATRAI